MSPASPRKQPRQARSRATVDALIEAAAQLLVERGYARTSTNQIATRAGVSVGSLYQYFPNKEALVGALIERFIDSQQEAFRAHIERAQASWSDLPSAVRSVIEGLMMMKRQNPALNRVLLEQVPVMGLAELARSWFERAQTLVRVTLESRRDLVGVEDMEMASYVLLHAVHGIIHHSVVYRQELLQREALTDEITALVLRYVQGGATTARI